MRTPAPESQQQPFLTPQDVADRLRVSRRYVYLLVSRGEFGDVVRVGDTIRIETAAYEAYVERNRQPASA